MQGVVDIWKRIWNQKYNMPCSVEGRLRVEETPRGSQIWELARSNKDLVRDFAFWEIREGNLARFWTDGWQQREKLERNPNLYEIQAGAQQEGMEYVKDYWRPADLNAIWRIWQRPTEWDQRISPETQLLFIRELDSRKIKIRPGNDILRWGKATQGMFTVKEAYYWFTKEDREEEPVDWKKLWEGKW